MDVGRRRDLESIVPFLPREPGLRAHVIRVGALAFRTAEALGYSHDLALTAEAGGLLHHWSFDEDAGGVPARLLADLGLRWPAALREGDSDLRFTANAAACVESANLFDEQMENLPYEDADTADVVRQFVECGVSGREFPRALAAFRVMDEAGLLAWAERLPGISEADAAALQVAQRGAFDAWRGWEDAGEQFREHAIQTAREASARAADIGGMSSGEAFLAGLVHDIGRLPMELSAAGSALEVWRESGFPVTYAELLATGTDHAAVGAEMLRGWGFPGSVIEAVRYHHRPELTRSPLAALLYSVEDPEEMLPSLARDHGAAKRLRSGRGASGG